MFGKLEVHVLDAVWTQVGTKNNLYRFIEGQTHFNNACGVEMIFDFYEPIENVLCSNLSPHGI